MDDLDGETADLVIKLQLEDVEELTGACEAKGKGREGELSDAQLAIRVFENDLRQYASVVRDRRMTGSISRACQTDGLALTPEARQEDREAARELGAMETLVVESEVIEDELLEKMEALYVQKPDFDVVCTEEQKSMPNNASESSTWAGSRAINNTSHQQCIACQDTFPFYEIATVPCGHEYCRSCLRSHFEASLVDTSLFPPRCCRQPIPLPKVRFFLTSSLNLQFNEKKLEHDTLDKTYCWNPSCSTFLRIEDGSLERVQCSRCWQVTCTICKGEEHTGHCPADTATQDVLAMANENGWRRCEHCKAIVELDTGCNHITCRCGSQFCYLCGQTWKTCGCAQWDENRLVDRAQQVVAREPARVNPQARIAAVAEHLRVEHDCEHQIEWRRVAGRHRCEECRDVLPLFIYECRQCRIRACTRCRFNRL